VAYGSNMLKERFMVYIGGGLFQGSKKIHKGCTDKSPPEKDKPFLVPYELYFGNESVNYGGSGVAFIDADKSGTTFGRAYLITEEQFFEIQKQEGLNDEWYGRIVEISSEDCDIPHKTFTSQTRRPSNSPCEEYLDIIRKGLSETYPQMRDYSGYLCSRL
jgi:hypothetical protein